MPTLTIVGGASIVMYYNDHEPPHFHAIHSGGEAAIQIADLQVLKGTLPVSTLNAVRLWASNQQGALALEWAKARSHLPLGRL